MTNIYLFSKNRKILQAFKKIQKSRTFALSIYNPKHYKHILSRDQDLFFTYLDLSSFTPAEKKKLISYVTRQQKFDYGILDPETWVKDPAALFHKGASDYIPGRALSGELSTKRIKSAIGFYFMESAEDKEEDADPGPVEIHETTWETIVEGNSYTFILMFIEIDMIKDWASHSGKSHINDVMDHFYHHLEKVITPLHGRIWIRTEYGALILFPFSGSTGHIIIECFKLQLNKIISSAEEYPYKTILSYKIALDIGTTQYLTRGNTGNIISDSVNYIFHLGHQYTPKGNFYLTNRIYADIPPGLLDYFTSAGNFQGKTIHRMILPKFT